MASILDDLFLRDNINIFRAGEHIVRRLYGLEEVLRLCGSREELEDAHWAAADAYDLPELVDAASASEGPRGGEQAPATKPAPSRGAEALGDRCAS